MFLFDTEEANAFLVRVAAARVGSRIADTVELTRPQEHVKALAVFYRSMPMFS